MSDTPQGCDLCADFPMSLSSQCHPSAPLRILAVEAHTLEIRCYVPTCDRKVATLHVADWGNLPPNAGVR
jgi:hypothetical protein